MSHSGKKDSRFHIFFDAETVKRNSAESSTDLRVEPVVEPSREELERKFQLPPRLFKHQDLTTPPKSSPRINKRKLTNRINHLNFTNEYLWAHLKDPRYEEDIFVRAYPEPCLGETITCQWSKETVTSFEYHRFLNLVIDDGMSAIVIPAKLLDINRDRCTIQMPEAGYILQKRQARRYTCREVTAELNQCGFVARGDLLDFSPFSFRTKVAPDSSGSFH